MKITLPLNIKLDCMNSNGRIYPSKLFENAFNTYYKRQKDRGTDGVFIFDGNVKDRLSPSSSQIDHIVGYVESYQISKDGVVVLSGHLYEHLPLWMKDITSYISNGKGNVEVNVENSTPTSMESLYQYLKRCFFTFGMVAYGSFAGNYIRNLNIVGFQLIKEMKSDCPDIVHKSKFNSEGWESLISEFIKNPQLKKNFDTAYEERIKADGAGKKSKRVKKDK